MDDTYRIRIAFSRSPVLGAIIREFTGGDVNHAFAIYFHPIYKTLITLGANSNGFTEMALREFPGHIVRVWRPLDVNLSLGMAAMADWLDKPYDYAGLLGMSVVEAEAHLMHRVAANPALDKHKLFCSEAMAMMVRKSGDDVLANYQAGSIDPYTLDRGFAALPQHFELDPSWACNRAFLPAQPKA